MEKQFIEVCAGCGGLSTGFMKAGYKPVLLNEMNKICVQTLQANHTHTTIHCGDVTKLDLTPYAPFSGILAAGVPCQSFSMSGLRKGLDDKRGNLILYFRTLIDQLQPMAFMIENVKGLTNHEKGSTFQTVLQNLNKDNDYEITYKILNAYDYEVPQKRERVFIVGIKKTHIEAMGDRWRAYTHPSPVPDVMRKVCRHVLQRTEEEAREDAQHPDHIGYQYSPEKIAVLNMIPQGGCWVDLPIDIQKSYLGKNYEASGGRRGMGKRLSMNEPCLTLTTNPCQNQAERCHPLETRPLTVLEYRRIQTFPDDFILHGAISSKFKQVGNAVPVMLAYHMARSFDYLFE